eukprot:s257_g47.t1
MAYTQISAGSDHTVLLRSDGSAVATGYNQYGQCNIPPLNEGMAYTQISAGHFHTVLLRSDGSAVAIGNNLYGQCNIPALDEGMAYTQIAAGGCHTVLLRSDGSKGHTVLLRNDGRAVVIGSNLDGKCNIPPLDEGIAYTQASAGTSHTGLLSSLPLRVAIGNNDWGQCDIPPLDEGMAYTQISAGDSHTVLLRSDGSAVAIGRNDDRRCNIPPLDEGTAYTQMSAGATHTVLLRSDGSAVAIGANGDGQCDIGREPGIRYVGDLTCGRDFALQLELVGEDDAVTLICSTLAGEERFRLTAQGVDSAWETHKRIAREMKVNLPNLQLVLPDGQFPFASDELWETSASRQQMIAELIDPILHPDVTVKLRLSYQFHRNSSLPVDGPLETKSGAYVYSGDPSHFHEWQFRTLLRVELCKKKMEQKAKEKAKEASRSPTARPASSGQGRDRPTEAAGSGQPGARPAEMSPQAPSSGAELGGFASPRERADEDDNYDVSPYVELVTKIMEGLRGDAFLLAKDMGLNVLMDVGPPVDLNS